MSEQVSAMQLIVLRAQAPAGAALGKQTPSKVCSFVETEAGEPPLILGDDHMVCRRQCEQVARTQSQDDRRSAARSSPIVYYAMQINLGQLHLVYRVYTRG